MLHQVALRLPYCFVHYSVFLCLSHTVSFLMRVYFRLSFCIAHLLTIFFLRNILIFFHPPKFSSMFHILSFTFSLYIVSIIVLSLFYIYSFAKPSFFQISICCALIQSSWSSLTLFRPSFFFSYQLLLLFSYSKPPKVSFYLSYFFVHRHFLFSFQKSFILTFIYFRSLHQASLPLSLIVAFTTACFVAFLIRFLLFLRVYFRLSFCFVDLILFSHELIFISSPNASFHASYSFVHLVSI